MSEVETKKGPFAGLVAAVKKFKKDHESVFEFIMFNLLSNIATITNFVMLNLGTFVLFRSLADKDFAFWIYDYPADKGGLGGFLSFLVAYASAQIVNFIVQKNLVFNSNNKSKWAIPIYVFTILVVYVICMYVPMVAQEPITNLVGKALAVNVVTAITIFIQVVVIFPVLKFVVMKKV